MGARCILRRIGVMTVKGEKKKKAEEEDERIFFFFC